MPHSLLNWLWIRRVNQRSKKTPSSDRSGRVQIGGEGDDCGRFERWECPLGLHLNLARPDHLSHRPAGHSSSRMVSFCSIPPDLNRQGRQPGCWQRSSTFQSQGLHWARLASSICANFERVARWLSVEGLIRRRCPEPPRRWSWWCSWPDRLPAGCSRASSRRRCHRRTIWTWRAAQPDARCRGR